MTRESTLIQDPNSLFAVSRALRKAIVRHSDNPVNRSNAIRDEKHVIYRSHNKEGYESYKYEILTNLDLLDNAVLELETVLGKITEDEKKLQEAVSAKKAKVPPKPKGKVGRPRKNPPKVVGSGFSGGAFTPDSSLLQELRRVMEDPSTSANFADVLRFLGANIAQLKTDFDNGRLSQEELETAVDELKEGIADNDAFNPDDITDEEDTMIEEIFQAVRDWIKPVVAPATPKTAPRRQIPLFSGNEFIISTLSKINTLLTKLIAEYNSKILVNYKNYLVTDIEEIGLKVVDSKRRFDDLKTYIEDYEAGTKVADISKFLSVIERKFRDFLSLSARSIANFVNPNLVLLPNFSQQLGETYDQRNLELTNPPRKRRGKIFPKVTATLGGFPLKKVDFERLFDSTFADFNVYREEYSDLVSRKRTAKEEKRMQQLDTIILPKITGKLDALRATPQFKKYYTA